MKYYGNRSSALDASTHVFFVIQWYELQCAKVHEGAIVITTALQNGVISFFRRKIFRNVLFNNQIANKKRRRGSNRKQNLMG